MAQHSKSHPQVDPGTAQQAAADHDEMIVVPKGQSRIQFFLILGLFIFILVIFTVGPFVQQVLGGLFQGAGPNAVYFRWVHPTTGETTELSAMDFQRRMKALDVLKQLGFYVPTAARDGDDPRADVTEAEAAMWIILDRLAQDRGIEVTPEDLRERIEMIYGSVSNYQNLLRQYRAQGFGVSAHEIEGNLASWMRAELYASLLQSTLAVADPAAVEAAWAEDPNNVEYAFDYVTLAAKEFTDAAKAEDPSDQALLDWLHTKPEHEQQHFRTDDRIVAEVAWIPLGEAEPAFDPTPLLAKYPTPAGWDEAAEAQRYYNQVSHMRFRLPQDEATPPGTGEGESGDDAPAAGEGEGSAPATGDEPPADDDGATSDDDGAATDEEGATSGDGGDGESQGGPFAGDAREGNFAQDDAPAPEEQEGGAESTPPAGAEAGDEAQDEHADDAETTAPRAETDDHAGHDHADGETPATAQEPPKLYRPFEEVEATCRAEARWKRALDDWLADLAARAQAGETIDLAAEAEALGLAYERTSEPRAREELEKAEGWGSPLVVGGLFFVQSGTFTRLVQVQEGAMVLGRQIEKVAGVERPIEEIRDRLLEHWLEQRAVALAVERLEAIRSTFPVPPAEEGEDEVVIDEEGGETTGEDAVATEDEETPEEAEEPLPVVDRETFVAAAEAAGRTVTQRPYLRRFSYPNDDFNAATPADHHIRTEPAYYELEEGEVAAPRASMDHTAAYLVRFAGQRVAPIETMKPSELVTLRAEVAQEAKTAFAKRYLRGDSPEVRRKFKIYLGSVDAPREKPEPATGSAQ